MSSPPANDNECAPDYRDHEPLSRGRTILPVTLHGVDITCNGELAPEGPKRLRRRSGVRSKAAPVVGVQGALFCLAPPVPVWHPLGRPGDGGAAPDPPFPAA